MKAFNFFSKSALAILLLAGSLSFASADRTPVNSGGSSATSTFGFITATTTAATSTFAGDVYITGNLRVSGTFFAPVAISAASHIRPSADNTYDLGSSTSRWANIWGINLFATSSTVTGNGLFGGTLGVTGLTTLGLASTTAVSGIHYGSFIGTTGTFSSTLGVSATSTLATTTISSLRLGFTNGSILYSNGNGQVNQANSNLFWDSTNFRLGINTASPAVSLQVATGSIAVSEYDWGTATSTTMSVDWKRANTQKMRISTAGVTITHVNATTTVGAVLKIVVCNAPTGTAGAITWGNPIYWSGGTAPTQTTTANKCDVWSFISTSATGTPVIFGSASTNF